MCVCVFSFFFSLWTTNICFCSFSLFFRVLVIVIVVVARLRCKAKLITAISYTLCAAMDAINLLIFGTRRFVWRFFYFSPFFCPALQTKYSLVICSCFVRGCLLSKYNSIPFIHVFVVFVA